MNKQALTLLGRALDGEYRALATYRAAIERFGFVEPFVHLAAEDEQATDTLRRIYERNHLTPPPDRWSGGIEAPQTLDQARRQALQAEADTAKVYERFLDEVEDSYLRSIVSQLEEACRYQRRPLLRRALQRRDV